MHALQRHTTCAITLAEQFHKSRPSHLAEGSRKVNINIKHFQMWTFCSMPYKEEPIATQGAWHKGYSRKSVAPAGKELGCQIILA